MKKVTISRLTLDEKNDRMIELSFVAVKFRNTLTFAAY